MQKSKILKCEYFFFAAVIIVVLYLFRGAYSFGLEYDEVFRINNWFQYFNDKATPYRQSICSIYIGDLEIPLMLKEYISYWSIVPYMVIALFHNPLVALRNFYFLYTVLSLIVVYYVLSKYNRRIAVFTVIYMAVNPILYPEIRYSMATLLYGIGLGLCVLFWWKYWENNKRRYLWLSVFLICLQVNILFYFAWVVGGLIVALLILYPKLFWKTVSNIKNLLVIISAAVLGLFNYIIYNVQNGFPSVKHLWNYLFNRKNYADINLPTVEMQDNLRNHMPISGNFLDDIKLKIDSYLNCIGPWKQLYFLLIVVLITVNIVYFVRLLRSKKMDGNKKYFLPGLVTILSFCFMVITPSSRGSHHLTYMAIPFAVWISCTIELVLKNTTNKSIKKFVYFAAVATVVVFFIQSNTCVMGANACGGYGYYANNIYDLIDYTDSHKEIDGSNTLLVEWGMMTQFYFIHCGEYEVNEMLWAVDPGQYLPDLSNFLDGINGDTFFMPIYYYNKGSSPGSGEFILSLEDSEHLKYDLEVVRIPYNWIQFFEGFGGRCSIEAVFEEKSGAGGIALLRIDGIDADTIKQSYIPSGFSFQPDDLLTFQGVKVENDELIFGNEKSMIVFRSEHIPEIRELEFRMKLFIDEKCDYNYIQGVHILDKYTSWQKNMSFAFAISEGNAFLRLSPDGTSGDFEWFGGDLLTKGRVHDMKFSYKNRTGILYIDNKVVFDRKYDYETLFASDDATIRIGPGLIGSVSEVYLNYN